MNSIKIITLISSLEDLMSKPIAGLRQAEQHFQFLKLQNMKKTIILLVFAAFSFIANSQTIISHISNPSNTSGHITTIDNLATNNQSEAILIVTQNYGVYNANEIGVLYSSGKWKIFNQNRQGMPLNNQFNILVLAKGTKSFVHTTTNSNTDYHITTLNHNATNGNSNALIFMTQNYGQYNNYAAGVWYDGNKWNIYNEGGYPLPIGTKFNVYVVNEGTINEGQINGAAFIHNNQSSDYVSWIEPSIANDKTSQLIISHHYNGYYNPNPIGVRYLNERWTVYNQNKEPITNGVQFSVLKIKSIEEETENIALGGYYSCNDDGHYYIRQVGNDIYWFGEHPNGNWANVFKGTINGNQLTGYYHDVPKGRMTGRGELKFEVSYGGNIIQKISGAFGGTSFTKTQRPFSLPADRVAAYSQTENIGDMDGLWNCNDGGEYYIREIDGKIIWFGEGGLNSNGIPAFANVAVGTRSGNYIYVDWADVPKCDLKGKGKLTLQINNADEITKIDGSGFGGSQWNRTPNVKTAEVILPMTDKKQKISYIVENNMAIFQGDIVLGTAEQIVAPKPEPHPSIPDFEKLYKPNNSLSIGTITQPLLAVSNTRLYLWFNGIVPYLLDNAWSSDEKEELLEAIQELDNNTNLTFIPHTISWQDHIYLKKVPNLNGGSSPIGRQGRRNTIRLGGTWVDVVIHEILHSVGFYHEQSRDDRDNFVEILWDNIEKCKKGNFKKHDHGIKIGNYDKGSVMHYCGHSFSKNDEPTILDKQTGLPFRCSRQLSQQDIDGVNFMYPKNNENLVTHPLTVLRSLKTTIKKVEANQGSEGICGGVEFFARMEVGPGWSWKYRGRGNTTENTRTSSKGGQRIQPNWVFRYPLQANSQKAKVYIRLMEDDGGFCGSDDHCDISPIPGMRDIPLLIETGTGEIWLSGEDQTTPLYYVGQVGQDITLEGYDGGLRANITFRIDIGTNPNLRVVNQPPNTKTPNTKTNAPSTNSFKVFPNPTIGKVTIALDQDSTLPHTFTLIDISGKIVQQGTITSNQTNLDLSNEAKGAYLIKIHNVQTKNILGTQKLLVK